MNLALQNVAVYAGGNLSLSSVAGLARLNGQLGPVKASSLRVASRISNTLRAGFPVAHVDSFADYALIALSVPDRIILGCIEELERSTLDWQGRVLIIGDTPRDSSVCAGLAARGAQVATFNVVAGMAVMEGATTAIREFRRLLLPRSARVVRLASGGKPLLFAGLTLASFTAHLAAAASDCLRTAGIEPGQARGMVHNLMAEALRAHTKAGRKAVDSDYGEPAWNSIRQQHAALSRTQPDLANYFAAAAAASAQLAGVEPQSLSPVPFTAQPSSLGVAVGSL